MSTVPSISNSILQLEEISSSDVQTLVGNAFQDMETRWPGNGSPFQNWYRQNASISSTVRDRHGCRLIAWKTSTPFSPQNIFFRTVDTNRLLPMALADFRVQIWADPSVWKCLDKKKDAREGWCTTTMVLMVHELLLLRNMHDQGGADIPVIAVAWDEAIMDRAIDYWVGLSKGEWSETERQASYDNAGSFCRRLLPTFAQVDLLVRALYADPAVGYIPPFIIFMPLGPEGKARILFTRPSHMLPQPFAESWPSFCGSPGCADSDCGLFDFTTSKCLADGTPMVREGPWLPHRDVCNLWGCEQKRRDTQSQIRMKRCDRCKEVIYCDETHQALDWAQHKKVCEKRR